MNPAFGLDDEPTDSDSGGGGSGGGGGGGEATVDPHGRQQLFTITASNTPAMSGQNGHCGPGGFRGAVGRNRSSRSRSNTRSRRGVHGRGGGQGMSWWDRTRRFSSEAEAENGNSGANHFVDVIGGAGAGGGDGGGGGGGGGDYGSSSGQNISDRVVGNGLICIKL